MEETLQRHRNITRNVTDERGQEQSKTNQHHRRNKRKAHVRVGRQEEQEQNKKKQG